jgi:uncharacterized SAM-binding protein YcdF (DUF218 family)
MLPISVRLAASRFLDPAFVLVVALGVALFFALRGERADAHRRRARAMAWLAWGALWAFSTPLVGASLLHATEIATPNLGHALAGKDPSTTALVVFGGGARSWVMAPTPRERLSGASMQRVVTAARLFREHRPRLVVVSSTPADAEGMADLMVALGVPEASVVREDRSLNTRDNAANSAKILRKNGIETVIVVTTAVHLRRSLKDLSTVGVEAIPAAADVMGQFPIGIDTLLPAASGLECTHSALHEILGYVRG